MVSADDWNALLGMLGEAVFDDTEMMKLLLFGPDRLDDTMPPEFEKTRWEWRRDCHVTFADMSELGSVPDGDDPWLVGDWFGPETYFDPRRYRLNPWFAEFPLRQTRHWCHELCQLYRRGRELLDQLDPTGALRAKRQPEQDEWFAGRKAAITRLLAERQARKAAL